MRITQTRRKTKCCYSKLNDNKIVSSLVKFLIEFTWWNEWWCSLVKQTSKFGIDGEKWCRFNDLIEFIKILFEICEQTNLIIRYSMLNGIIQLNSLTFSGNVHCNQNFINKHVQFWCRRNTTERNNKKREKIEWTTDASMLESFSFEYTYCKQNDNSMFDKQHKSDWHNLACVQSRKSILCS